jgi:hypothetical protein
VHQFHQTWRAVDGRRDPAQAGGHALVQAFDAPAQAHADMIASGEIKEITGQNVSAIFLADLQVSVRSIAEANEALKELCGADNPPFKRVERLSQDSRKVTKR